MMLNINKIYNMDCLSGIKNIPIPDLIICDPPYEFENKGGGLYSLERTKKLMNKIKEIGTDSFDFEKFIPKILNLQKNKVNAYFFCNKSLLPKYLSEAVKRGLIFDILVMHKINPIPAFNNSYMNDLEYVVFLRSKGSYFNSNNGYSNYKKVFSLTIGNHKYVHPNQKPAGLIKKFVENSSIEGDLVLDCFMGSGTTAICCKASNRNFIGFEKSKLCYDISINRLKQRIIKGVLEV